MLITLFFDKRKSLMVRCNDACPCQAQGDSGHRISVLISRVRGGRMRGPRHLLARACDPSSDKGKRIDANSDACNGSFSRSRRHLIDTFVVLASTSRVAPRYTLHCRFTPKWGFSFFWSIIVDIEFFDFCCFHSFEICFFFGQDDTGFAVQDGHEAGIKKLRVDP